jgi:hypothetical protein
METVLPPPSVSEMRIWISEALDAMACAGEPGMMMRGREQQRAALRAC